MRFRIRDGELEVRAPTVTSGYWGDAEATADALTEDGWLRTGDRVEAGLFGTVRFRGRAKDVIKVGGYSVYAVEVEAVLAAHPAVAEAAVLGVADERLGEVPVAAVRSLRVRTRRPTPTTCWPRRLRTSRPTSARGSWSSSTSSRGPAAGRSRRTASAPCSDPLRPAPPPQRSHT